MNIREILNTKEYDFLKKEFFKNDVIFLTLAGSIAYGTNIQGSDIDLRGIVKNTKTDMLGLSSIGINKVEQFEDFENDTVIYKLNKIYKLFLNCNPNAIELLYTLPEHRIVNDIGQLLIDNRDIFLSQLIYKSFNGFAISQLHRLHEALNEDGKTLIVEQLQYEKDRLESLIPHFNNIYGDFKHGSICFEVDYEEEKILINNNLKKYPIESLMGVYSEINSILTCWKKYKKLKQREKDSLHLNKHAMHTLKLLMQGNEILSKGTFSTYIQDKKEHDLLMDIRFGKYEKKNKTYDEAFFTLVSEYNKKFQIAKENTKLPLLYNEEKAEKLLMELNLLSLK